MNWWKAIVLGLVQGLTEFLPVSSSGHLVIAESLLNVTEGGSTTFYFVMLHFATAIAVIVGLWKPFKSLFTRQGAPNLLLLVIASIPAAIAGFLFDDKIEALLGGGSDWLWIFFLITAAVLLTTELVAKRTKQPTVSQASPETVAADLAQNEQQSSGARLRWWQALIMGAAQAVAIFPGISRSGSTICAGILARGEKEKVADFSFLMSLPVIGGAALLELIDVFQTGAYAGVDWLCVALGMLAAFGSGLFAIKLMLALIKRVNYKYFSIYLAVLSIVLMILQFTA
jgi:undecaprenyl-diphosphatase